MRKKSYIMAVAALSAAAILAGCSGKDNKDGAGSKKTEEKQAVYEDEALNFKVTDYVKLGDYKGLEVSYPEPFEVSKEDVDDYIQSALEENTEYKEDKERKAQNGDSVNIDYTGTIDGEEFEGGTDTGYDLELGSEDFLPDFESSLVGKKAGETAVFKVTFPEEYGEELAGKEAEFTVKINSVSEIIVPEYNVEFVKSVSDYETLEDYENSIKEELIASAKSDSEVTAGENALSLAIENAEVEGYPQALYDFFYDDTVAGYQAYAEMMGMEYKEFMESFMGEDDVEAIVLEQVNDYLVSRAILEQEGIAITEESYQEAAKGLLEDYEYETLEELEADYGKTYLMTQVTRDKAIEFLQGSAKLKEVSQDEYYADEEEIDMEEVDEEEIDMEEVDEE